MNADTLVYVAIVFLIAMNIAIATAITFFPSLTRVDVAVGPGNRYMQFAMMNAIDYTGNGCWHKTAFDAEGRQYCLNGTNDTYIYDGMNRELIIA